MTVDRDLLLRVGETKEQYIVRVSSHREQYGYTWEDVADIINDQLGLNYNECTYRKAYASFRKLTDALGGTSDERLLEELREAKRELYKERTKLRDERNEYNAALRAEARYENAIEQFSQVIRDHVQAVYEPVPAVDEHPSEAQVVAMISDMHCGLTSHNMQTDFTPEILRNLLDDYRRQIAKIGRTHGANVLHVLLGGDLISGVIHTTLRIEASKNVIEQVMSVSDMLSHFINECSKSFEQVHVRCVSGNHGRVVAGKDDALRGENFDALIPHYLSAALQNNGRVTIHDSSDPTVDVFTVLGKRCALVHGDRDKSATVAEDLAPLVGNLDYIFMGHTHTTAMVPTKSSCRVIVNGSFPATDSYAFDHRYFSKPEQCAMVLTTGGYDLLCRCLLKGGEKDESV